MKQPKPYQDGDELRWFSQTLTQFVGAGVGLTDFRGAIAFDCEPCWTKRGMYEQLLFVACSRIRQRIKQPKSRGEVINRFDIGRALDGSFPCPLPVWNSLL